jgi:hypothetical protein
MLWQKPALTHSELGELLKQGKLEHEDERRFWGLDARIAIKEKNFNRKKK